MAQSKAECVAYLRACRQDPPSQDQFGDGKYQVQWTRDLEEYDQWWQRGTAHTQRLARQLEEEGRPKSAARVRAATFFTTLGIEAA